MATQYIKYTKKCEKSCFFKIIGEGAWPGGGYAHVYDEPLLENV